MGNLVEVGSFATYLERFRAEHPRLRPPRPLNREGRPWYRISAKADPEAAPEAGDEGDGDAKPTKDGPDTTVVDIYDEIGWLGTDAKDFIRDLRGIKTPNIEVHLNSPGGDVFDAVAIYNGLRQHKAQVHVIVDSLAASSASFIAMAGDKVTAMANAMLMIHDPWGLVVGNAADMRELADLLDKHGDNIAGIYANRAGGPVSDWRQRMQEETWYLADEAYEAGLVDVVDESDGRPVEDRWDLSVFAHAAPTTAATITPDRSPDPAPTAQTKAAPTPIPDAPTTPRTRGGNSYLGEAAGWYLPNPTPEEAKQ